MLLLQHSYVIAQLRPAQFPVRSCFERHPSFVRLAAPFRDRSAEFDSSLSCCL